MACLDDKQQLIVPNQPQKDIEEDMTLVLNEVNMCECVNVPSLLPHLFKSVPQLVVGNLLRVLELEEPITTMTCMGTYMCVCGGKTGS